MKHFIFIVLTLTLLGAGCWNREQSQPSPEPTPQPTSTQPTPSPEPAPSPSPTPSNIAPEPQVFQDATGSIRVTNLYSGQLMTNPFIVKGTAVAFESTFQWKLADDTGWVLAQGYEMAAQPDAGIPGPFTIFGFYDKIPKSSTGTLIVFEASAKDGTPIHVVKIPVKLVNESQKVTAYYGNSKKNPGVQDCSLVYPVTRYVAKAERNWLPYVAVNAMLKGPTASEKTTGYYTSLPEGVKLIGSTAQTGVKAFNFDQTLQYQVGGSCRVQAIRSQINTTSLQNGGGDILIAVDGKTEDVLQP